MGRSVSYPSGAIVAFTVLEVEAEDDWEFEYKWLRDDLQAWLQGRPVSARNGGIAYRGARLLASAGENAAVARPAPRTSSTDVMPAARAAAPPAGAPATRGRAGQVDHPQGRHTGQQQEHKPGHGELPRERWVPA